MNNLEKLSSLFIKDDIEINSGKICYSIYPRNFYSGPISPDCLNENNLYIKNDIVNIDNRIPLIFIETLKIRDNFATLFLYKDSLIFLIFNSHFNSRIVFQQNKPYD